MADVIETVDLHLEGDAATLIKQLADLRGVSAQEAVAEAVRHDLERERLLNAKVERIMAAAAAVRATMTPPLPTSDHGWLYDKNGSPA